MRPFKHILVVVALLAAMLPCGHAGVHHDHGHDADAGQCALAAEPCECHSCDHQPCSDDIEIQLDLTPVSETIVQPVISDVLYVLPEIHPALNKTIPPVSGILAALQTIQLLI